MKVCIVGLGEIGTAVLNDMQAKKQDFEYIAVDNDPSKFGNQPNVSYTMSPLPSDVYVICVYSTEEVISVLRQLDYSNSPLVVIESTISPESEKEINELAKNIVFFPHRFHAGSTEHGVFNQSRVMGGSSENIERAIEFYKNFMDSNLITKTTSSIAVISKVVENAYRFTEIAVAEEIKILCDKNGIDFKELRKCTNTKWNIDIKKALEGIYGRCLSKDMELLNDFFKENKIFSTAIEIDKNYKETKNSNNSNG